MDTALAAGAFGYESVVELYTVAHSVTSVAGKAWAVIPNLARRTEFTLQMLTRLLANRNARSSPSLLAGSESSRLPYRM